MLVILMAATLGAHLLSSKNDSIDKNNLISKQADYIYR